MLQPIRPRAPRNLGFAGLGDLAEAMERLARSGQREGAGRQLEALRAEAERVRVFLAKREPGRAPGAASAA